MWIVNTDPGAATHFSRILADADRTDDFVIADTPVETFTTAYSAGGV